MKFLSILVFILSAFTAVASDQKLVVHEWGTFTSLQSEDGRTLGGINADDEGLPSFVQSLSNSLISSPEYKGIGAVHPDIAMRLETPVVYFHPSPEMKLPLKLDLNVEFKSGWLTQFYPPAEAVAPGLLQTNRKIGRLLPATVGKASWKGLQVGVDLP